MNELKSKGKDAVVTDAASGIGKAIATASPIRFVAYRR
jgi:NADP-dependent 3-hydroxy acid dehydrogenase YdfG